MKPIQNILLTVPKEDSAFVYFILESHEGLCFYSTIDEQNDDSKNSQTRTIHLQFSQEWETPVHHLITHLRRTIPIHLTTETR
jgi:hypothetical protein